MIAHGAGRFTKDIDLLVDDAPENLARLKRALSVLADNVAAEIADDDIQRHVVVRVADEVAVDLMGRACGLTYAEAARDAETLEREGVFIKVASPATLIRTKGHAPAGGRAGSRRPRGVLRERPSWPEVAIRRQGAGFSRSAARPLGRRASPAARAGSWRGRPRPSAEDGSALPLAGGPAGVEAADRDQDAEDDGLRARWAAGDVGVDRENAVDAAGAGVSLADDAPGGGAGSHGDHDTWLRNSLDRAAAGGLQVACDRAGDHDPVRVARGGDEVDAEATHAVDWIQHELHQWDGDDLEQAVFKLGRQRERIRVDREAADNGTSPRVSPRSHGKRGNS